MTASKNDNGCQILDAVFEACPGHRRTEQRERTHRRFRGSISRPQEAHAQLLRRFDEEELVDVGVMQYNPRKELQLSPKLCIADGIVVALRKTPDARPFDLLTQRGLVASNRHPVLAALDDGRVTTLVKETGILLALHRIKDLLWCDLLNLPATLGLNFSNFELQDWRKLDKEFGEGLPALELARGDAEHAPPQDTEAAEDESDEGTPPIDDTDWQPLLPGTSPAMRPALIFVEQLDPRRPRRPTDWLTNLALDVQQVRQTTGLPLSGLWAWDPEQDVGDWLDDAFGWQDRQHFRNTFLQSLACLVDIAEIFESDEQRLVDEPTFLEARRVLLHRLSAGPLQQSMQRDQLEDAVLAFDAALQREVWEPLVNWALRQANPCIQAAGRQLADVAVQLQRMAPTLHALQLREMIDGPLRSGVGDLSEIYEAYSRLMSQFHGLSKVIAQWILG